MNPSCCIFCQNGLEQFQVSTQIWDSGNAFLISEIIAEPCPNFLIAGLYTITLWISTLLPLMNIQQFEVGILPLYIQQFSFLGCSQNGPIPFIETVSSSILHACFLFCISIFIFILSPCWIGQGTGIRTQVDNFAVCPDILYNIPWLNIKPARVLGFEPRSSGS